MGSARLNLPRVESSRDDENGGAAHAKIQVHTIYYPYFWSGAAGRPHPALQFVSLRAVALALPEIFDFLEQKPHLYLLNYNYLVLVRVRRADDAAADD